MEDILIAVFPVIIVIGVWVFIVKRFIKYNKNNKFVQNQEEMNVLLREIRDELKDLNKKNSIN